MTRRSLLTGLLLAVLAIALAVPAEASARRAPKAAVAAALERAVFHYALPEKIRVTATLRSDVDRSWSLVTGSYGRRGLWAAWAHRGSSGRYRVEIFRTRNFDPGDKPPCDIRPAFSEPEC